MEIGKFNSSSVRTLENEKKGVIIVQLRLRGCYFKQKKTRDKLFMCTQTVRILTTAMSSGFMTAGPVDKRKKKKNQQNPSMVFRVSEGRAAKCPVRCACVRVCVVRRASCGGLQRRRCLWGRALDVNKDTCGRRSGRALHLRGRQLPGPGEEEPTG